jgi:hypothetical protein
MATFGRSAAGVPRNTGGTPALFVVDDLAMIVECRRVR